MAECYLDILAETIRNNWNQPALTDFYLTEDGNAQDTSRGNHYTYGEMYAEIVQVTDLLSNLGVRKGDHIAICGANSAHWVIAYLAIAKMQGVSVTVMHSLQPDEIARLVDFSDAKALFVDRELWPELKEQSLSQVESVIALEEWMVLRGEKISLPFGEEKEVGFPHQEPDNLAMICFTSGSSGMPKGVMLSYRNINICNIINLYPKCENNNILSLFPYAHMSGLMYEIISQLSMAKHINTFCSLRSVDAINVSLKIVQPYAFASTPSLMRELYKRYKENFINYLSSCCKFILLGGASLDKELAYEIIEKNLPISNGYGMSEAGTIISGSTAEEYRFPSCGRVLIGNKVWVASNGEILVKGENVMLGYYKDPAATAQKIDKDGWLHTGDKGHLDEDGYLYVEGRLEQDIIVLPNGENIRPDNIESLINALPEVKESIVFARDGKLVAIVVPQITDHKSPITNTDLRRKILRSVNPQLPLFSQLYDVEITSEPLARTEKQTLKRYLYS